MSLPFSTGLVWLTSPRQRPPRRYWIPVPGQRSDNDAGATARTAAACAAEVEAAAMRRVSPAAPPAGEKETER